MILLRDGVDRMEINSVWGLLGWVAFLIIFFGADIVLVGFIFWVIVNKDKELCPNCKSNNYSIPPTSPSERKGYDRELNGRGQ